MKERAYIARIKESSIHGCILVALFASPIVRAESTSWSFSLDNNNSLFSHSGTYGSDSNTILGTISRPGSGFLKQTVTTSSGPEAPSINSTFYGMEVPRVMLIQPPILSGESKLNFSVSAAGQCPTRNMTFNFLFTRVGTSSRDNMSSTDQPAAGTYTWDSVGNAATITALRSVQTPLANVSGFSPFSLPGGTCSNGLVLTTGSGDRGGSWRFSVDWAGFYQTSANNGALFFPQAQIADASYLAGNYAVYRYETTSASAEVITNGRVTISKSGLDISGYALLDPSDANSINSGDPIHLTVANLNSPFPGMFTGTIGSGSSKYICMVYFSSQKIIYCAGQSPSNSNRIINLAMVADAQTFNLAKGPSGASYGFGLQSDGKAIVSGYFTSVGSTSVPGIARFNSDGSFDTGWTPGATGAVGAIVSTIAPFSNGKIGVIGGFSSYQGSSRTGLARLLSNGQLDTAFNPVLAPAASASAIVEQSSSQMIVGGTFTTVGGASFPYLARLNSDGTLDTGFAVGTGPDASVTALGVQPDGKVLVGGNFANFNGTSRPKIARLNSDGSLDTSFNPVGGPDSSPVSFSVQADGKVLVAGAFTTYNSITKNYAVRLNTDGSLDSTFDTGTTSWYIINTVPMPNGKIWVGGRFTTIAGATIGSIARLNSDGSLDATANVGSGTSGSVNGIAANADGSLVIAGQFSNLNAVGRNYLARYTSSGTLDTGYNAGQGASFYVIQNAQQTDGRTIIAGAFTSYGGVPRNRVARVNADGTLDMSFDPGTGASGQVNLLGLQPDGKSILAGAFTSVNGTARAGMARLGVDGSLDTTFTVGTGAGNTILAMKVQADGKAVIGGNFASFNGTSANYVTRLTSAGAVDGSFNTGTGANTSVASVALQPDGKILLGGSFTSFNGTSINRIVRLNSNGTVDGTFNPGSGADGTINVIVVDGSNRILIGGNFLNFNGTGRARIARLTSTGALDSTFDPGTGASATVGGIAVQPSDGQILISGTFTTVNGYAVPYFTRLSSAGAVDTSFNSGGMSPSYNAGQITVQSDGKILLSGSFAVYGTTNVQYMVRLLPNGLID